MFDNRQDAGRQLATELLRFKNQQPCVLALPRGGVPVAFEVAKALQAPLDLVIVRKIGAPDQPELAVGAVVDGQTPELVLNCEIVAMLDISDAYLAEEKARQIQEIERRQQAYLLGRPRLDVSARTALIVDDGIATGATIRAALRATRRVQPKSLVLAVPVAPTETIEALRGEADEIVCLEVHDYFPAISVFYGDFTQVNDEEVRDLLTRAAQIPPAPAGSGPEPQRV
jgi:putative phosphoribosyl transferase